MNPWRDLSGKSPGLEKTVELLKNHPGVVILSKQKDVLEQANQSLKQIGLEAKILSEHEIQNRSTYFTMTIIKVYTPEKNAG